MEIHTLSEETINRIAAGEVVERPVNAAKELIENAIDAGSDAITVEIKDGGLTMLRVTDNGCGIEPTQITKAFMRHATSKIEDERDLMSLSTLGFRGEALSSIAAVSQVEMITKVRGRIIGVQATNAGLGTNEDGSSKFEIREVGAPDGTTVIVRNLFYNVPVRRKFMKSAQTEAGYITDLIEHMALSHPGISFHYRINGKDKLHTSGNNNVKELIYRIYGRDISKAILPVNIEDAARNLSVTGYVGKPEISRGTRSYETFFVNGRYLGSDVLSKALEMGYGTDLMQHQFPFAVLYLRMDPETFDVNVHPSKKEIRFSEPKEIYDFVLSAVSSVFAKREMIPDVDLSTAAEQKEERKAAVQEAPAAHYEIFETEKAASDVDAPAHRIHHNEAASSITASDDLLFVRETKTEYTAGTRSDKTEGNAKDKAEDKVSISMPSSIGGISFESRIPEVKNTAEDPKPADLPSVLQTDSVNKATQYSMFVDQSDDTALDDKLLVPEKLHKFEIHGQIFGTYWLASDGEKLLMVDQHAAHEKVRYEHLMQQYRASMESPAPSQRLLPPIILQLSGKEEAVFLKYIELFRHMGFELEEFGSSAYAVRAVPMELYGNDPIDLFHDVIDELLTEKLSGDPEDILSRIATMSCKAAVKGNSEISTAEFKALLDELMTLENPYRCPHGRPTMITLSKHELEKKFKRII